MAQKFSYDDVVSVSEAEFQESAIKEVDLNDPEQFTMSSAEEIEKIERLLDLREGILRNERYYVEHYTCQCGHLLTMKDFVLTAIVDARHDRALIIQTLLGNKLIVNRPRPIRCFDCGRCDISSLHKYSMPENYHCSGPN